MAAIAIIGYGKMGKEIERIAKERGIEVKALIDPLAEGASAKEISAESMQGVDVAIDFTHPDVIMDNIRKLAELKVNTVIGTTGWHDKIDEVRKLAEENDVGIMWSFNFSIGVNAFFRIVEEAAKIMNKVEEYDVWLHEYHHNQKADSPSGTARTLSDILLKNIDRKKELLTDTAHEKIRPEQLHVTSTRVGNIPGTHTVGFDSTDTIELTHRARSRSGFALGAVLASQWLAGKKGFFGIDDFMNELIG